MVAIAPAAAFERAERREPCAEVNPLRNPYFVDTHVHTSFSFDASALGVRTTPRDAYRFARGELLALRPYDDKGNGRRTARLRRPLDFTVVTDHAELLGETHICRTPGAPGYASLVCRVYRRWPLLAYIVINSRMLNIADPVRYGFCGSGGATCRGAASIPRGKIQEAAEEFYDRTRNCAFTTFVGYEVERQSGFQHDPPQRDLPERSRPLVSDHLRRRPAAGGPVGQAAQRVPRSAQRLRRSYHPPQLEPERRLVVPNRGRTWAADHPRRRRT